MKITGVMILRNAMLNNYPAVESIKSILPLVDKMIVSLDKGEDDTEDNIRRIDSSKIKIIYSNWDLSIRKGGEILAVETNKALDAVSENTDWIFYLQADEIIHEKYLPVIKKACEYYLKDKSIDGLLFNYLHFYGTYDYVGDSRKWYNVETRIIRNDKTIRSYKDAQGFRRMNKKISVAAIPAYVFHYGWVKSPKNMKLKQKNVVKFWVDNEQELQQHLAGDELFDFQQFDSLRKFTDSHPAVMQERVATKNWDLNLDISKKKMKLKDRILYEFEKITGIRLFSFRNHRIIKKYKSHL